MKKCKFIKSGIVIAILGCSIIFTACDVNTDKKVEKQANKVVDAVESKDITKLDAIINGTDEIKADEELKDFFETDTEAKQKNGLMSKIIEHDAINVKKVGKDTVTYKITAPDFSKYFTEMKKSEVTEENIESFTDDYISNAEKVTNEVEIPYTYKDGIYSAEYDTEQFVNALTGNLVTAYQELMQDVQKELSEETGDEKIISILLSAIILLTTGTAYATETKSADISYNTLPVEFSDNLGTTENLDAMVDDGRLYVNAKQLGERLGYQVKAGDEYVAVFNKEFSNNVPYGITTFYYDSTKVGHMLFNKMVDYEAPFKTVKNADGEWIPFEFSLLLLNSSDVLLDKKIHVDMPEKNIVDIYMDVLKNNDRYLFDWEADAGATPGSMFAMGTAANMVQIFNGVLDWDGASWCQLINSFSMDSSSYDAKYSESFAKMFCTYSDEELSQDVDAMKEKLKPFDGGEWISDSMKDIDDLYDDKIGDLSRATADWKKKVVAENKASMIAFNKSYQELDKLCSKTDIFNHLTNVLDDFYSIVEIAGYASEFQNQDKFAVKSLDTFIKNSNYGSVMSTAMKDGLSDYKNILETDIVTYSAYNYLMNNMGDMLKDAIDISTALLDTESKIYLLIWDISKGTFPWVKNGLSNTDCFLQSMYAGIVQSDTFKSYIDKRDTVFKDANNITSKNLYEVTQYCYAYLKSCYITRDAAVGALTEKTKEDNPTYESTQKMVNQEIAKCLVKLKDADKTNKYGCYGFLPENNNQYLSEYDDGELLKCVVSSVDGEELYKDVLDMYYYKIKIRIGLIMMRLVQCLAIHIRI